ncbi:MAG: helix-turn-helix transcriptional regulator [Defluviitaleaceae bacterium]|nr:helix-turn-helix transcriptional regulator [Defluviitaleaceae bacterium]
MTIGEKIKKIRCHLGLSQENLAKDIGCGVATISRIERGMAECDENMLKAIKAAMGIKNAPFSDAEIAAYRESLFVWLELMAHRRIDDAKDLGSELAVILNLPFERDLIMLYHLYDAGLCITIGDFDDAENKMNSLDKAKMNGEHLFQYYRNLGTLCFRREDYERALEYGLRAIDYSEYTRGNLAAAYYSIAADYSMLSQPVRAIMYLEEARKRHKNTPLSILSVFIEHVLCKSYLLLNESERAKPILDAALTKAEAIGVKLGRKKYIGMILNLLGVYHMKRSEHKEALAYFNKAHEYFWVGGLDYFHNSYYKARCLLELKQAAQAKELAADVLANATNSERFTMLFDGLRKEMHFKENGSAENIENVIIPYLIGKSELFFALDFCEHLECRYKKAGNSKKANEIAIIMRDIYAKIIFG